MAPPAQTPLPSHLQAHQSPCHSLSVGDRAPEPWRCGPLEQGRAQRTLSSLLCVVMNLLSSLAELHPYPSPRPVPSRQYSAAIRAFLASDSLSERERANLIAVAHSGAGGSMYTSPSRSHRHNSLIVTPCVVLHWHSDCRPWNPRPQTFPSPASSWPKRRSSGAKPGPRCSSCTRSWAPPTPVARRAGHP